MNERCDFHDDALPDYVAGRLEPRRMRALETHLPDCAACRADLEVIRLIGQDGAGNAPAGLADGIIAALEADASGPRRRSWRPWALPLAAAAVAAGVWIGVTPRDGGQDPEVVAAEEYAPYGQWPAGDGIVAGQAVLSDLTDEQLEQLLEEFES